MKKIITFQLFFLIIASNLVSQSLEAWFDYKSFYVPDKTSYVETHLNFTGTSLNYKIIDDSLKQAIVEATILIAQNDEVVTFKKVNIEGPVVYLHEYPDFLDIQRFELENGDYKFEIKLADINRLDNKPLELEQEFSIKALDEGLFISDIELVKAYSQAEISTDLSKSGYNILPFVSNYFPSDYNSLIFYAEAYNADKYFGADEKYALAYSIRDFVSGELVQNLQVLKRADANSVNPILYSFDITSLPSGDYNLLIEMRDKKNEVQSSKKLHFYRNKKQVIDKEQNIVNIDVTSTFAAELTDVLTLRSYTNSLSPIADFSEKRAIDSYSKLEDPEILQKFFYYFWSIRNPENPEAAWMKYKTEVEMVNEKYGTRIKQGYETDRGRVFLQYGPPNSIAARQNDSGVKPYEIWHYYRIKNYSNKRFLFWNPDLVTNDYELLHSDVPGEVVNSNWYSAIVIGQNANRRNGTEVFDRANMNENASGEILKDLYFHPR